MDPYSIASLAIGGAGALGSTLSKMFGGGQTPADLERQNYELMLYDREQQRALANRIREEQKLGYTDERGSRTHFVPGRGWVAELSPIAQQLQSQSDREELARLSQDLPRQRIENVAEQQQRGQARNMAGGLQEAIRQQIISQQSQDDARKQAIAAASRGRSDEAVQAANPAIMQAIRYGGSNAGNILSSITRNLGRRANEASTQAQLNAPQLAAGNLQSRITPNMSLYTAMANRAARYPQQPFNPTQAGAIPRGMELAAAGRGAQGDAALLASYSQPSFRFGQVQDDTTDTLGLGGMYLGGLLGTVGAQNRADETSNALIKALMGSRSASTMAGNTGTF